METNRFALHPIRDQESFKMFKIHESTFWTSEEINFQQDKTAFSKLKKTEQDLIIKILAFFSGADFLVGLNLNKYFLNNPHNSMETDFFYSFQGAMECIHSETYSLMITNLIEDGKLRDSLFNACQHYPFIKMKIDWIRKWIDNETATYPQRLFAFALVEGLLFSASFSSIMFLKNKGVEMNGLIQSNELIMRDEFLHFSFSLMLFNRHNKGSEKLSEKDAITLLKEACDVEKEFARDLLKDPILGLSLESMERYIEYLGNMILSEAGFAKVFQESLSNPFKFMKEGYVVGTKTNFFEKQSTNYMLSSHSGDDNITFPV